MNGTPNRRNKATLSQLSVDGTFFVQTLSGILEQNDNTRLPDVENNKFTPKIIQRTLRQKPYLYFCNCSTIFFSSQLFLTFFSKSSPFHRSKTEAWTVENFA